MCGIAGIMDMAESPGRSLLEKMCGIMTHRGPDGEGYYFKGPVALGHRRLSIIDIKGGNQPMSNEDGTVWITYNGEIYNFTELRKELIDRGHRFKTRSDTETIIHAYEEYGFKCLDKLRGMFAFGIWDEKKEMLFLARDRLGKKPLYYYNDNKRFIFASELKAIYQDQRVQRVIDPAVLVDYLTYNYIPFPKTIFKNMHKLAPGHFMSIQSAKSVPCKGDVTGKRSNEITDEKVLCESEGIKVSIEDYWDIRYDPDYSLSERDWSDALREKIKEAVKIRLISDVPLGAFLSGGIDSSTIVAMMSMVQESPVKTFSVGFQEEDFSEVHYARQIAEKFGSDHHEMIVEPDALEILPELAWEFDEPFADSSAIPTYYVSKIARENVTVILSGDGGDETFAGYRRYAWAQDMQRYDRIPAWLKKIVFGVPANLLPDGIKGKGMLRHLSRDPFERYAGLNTFSDQIYLNNILSLDVLAELGRNRNGNMPDYSHFRKYYESCNSDDYLTRIQYLDTKVYLAEDILTKVDRASMLCSLETRAPLLDHEVVELAARIPSSMKIHKSQMKYILKKAMQDILPDCILHRKKMGFGVPLIHWFKGDISDYSRDVLLSCDTKTRGLFNGKYIEAMIHIHKQKSRDLSARIWALLFFEHWSRNWM